MIALLESFFMWEDRRLWLALGFSIDILVRISSVGGSKVGRSSQWWRSRIIYVVLTTCFELRKHDSGVQFWHEINFHKISYIVYFLTPPLLLTYILSSFSIFLRYNEDSQVQHCTALYCTMLLFSLFIAVSKQKKRMMNCHVVTYVIEMTIWNQFVLFS